MQHRKSKIRLLPVLIFIAVLTLSIRINNVFDFYNDPHAKLFSIDHSQALAEEKINAETAELKKILNDAPQNTKNPENGNSAFSQSEIMILQELAERREALDLRAQEIDKKAIQLKVAEEEIDKKIKQLKAYEQKLEKLIHEYDDKERQNLASLVKLYTTMKPKDAARIFDTLDTGITVALLKGMKADTSSAILSQMKPEKAKIITSELLGNNF